ncbi:hypothetical protein JY651_07890 [Pyxidicoccus parkwayensis]|uniref:Uncharacterized protein n=1 Tax=Pyxidicoccus parkwayensis TaxID=2813578 RepID=A0ABX7P328_9BACT|nr:hypothetical protein [Pyxidicoccus parkwaysis]QSQ24851.1 hypothetical protein JY651_07890 [Pyxidicoccus parkwaysis]
MNQPPAVVRAWPDEDVLGIVAEAQLEREESERAPSTAPSGPAARGVTQQRTLIYRVRRRPGE